MSISKKSLLTVITPTLMTVCLVMLSLPAQARIKCWENSDGVRECGEKVPPEYAQKSHKEISNQGITLDESERAKTDEAIGRRRAALVMRRHHVEARS